MHAMPSLFSVKYKSRLDKSISNFSIRKERERDTHTHLDRLFCYFVLVILVSFLSCTTSNTSLSIESSNHYYQLNMNISSSFESMI